MSCANFNFFCYSSFRLTLFDRNVHLSVTILHNLYLLYFLTIPEEDMASHETASVAVFPTNLQNHSGNLVKETTPVTLPPPANSVQHLACSSTSQSPAVNVVEKAYSPHNLSPAKTTGKLVIDVFDYLIICLPFDYL